MNKREKEKRAAELLPALIEYIVEMIGDGDEATQALERLGMTQNEIDEFCGREDNERERL